MKQRLMLLLFGLGFFLGLLVLAGSKTQPVSAESGKQNTHYEATLTKTANQADIVADGLELMQENPCAGLTPDKIRAGGVTVLQCKLHCESILPAGDSNNRSDEELWACINGSGGQPDGDLPVVPVDPLLPEPEQPVMPVQPNDACTGVTPYDFRVGSQESVVCRLLCEQSGYQSDEELWACIQYYGGQPGDGTPIFPVNPPDSDQPRNLGPLATTPLIPLAGALIGTIVGWLVSVAATSGSVLKPFFTPSPKPSQPAAIPTGPKVTISPMAQTPAQLETPIPASDPVNVQTPDQLAAPPKSPAEHLWDIATNLVGSSAMVTSSLSEFFDFQEDVETVKRISDSLQAWKNNPTKAAAEAYLKNLSGLTRQNAVLAKAGKLLGNAANVLDGVDGVIKGVKKANERGYVGSDYALTVAAEEGKKILNFALTKNPVVGLVNSAFGSATEMVYGKDGRIDVGAIIDKGADAWDNTTQEYAGYTGGDLFAPNNENFGDVLAKDPELQRKDQYLHGVRQIKKQVEQGEISLQEGGARIRRLRDAILGGK